MVDRLSPLDALYLYVESRTTPMHVGGIGVFNPPAQNFNPETFVSLVKQRIALVPRYRQKLQSVPGWLASPVWIDDPDFDINFHVRHAALPKPGSDAQLREFISRVMSQLLDRSRPLWEIYILEGLQHNRLAIITKSHHAMVDGVSAVDIGQVILDPTPIPRVVSDDGWEPRHPPHPIALVYDALIDVVRRPSAALDAARVAVLDAKSTARRLTGTVVGLAAAVQTAARPAPSSPLNVPIGEQRLFGTAITRLDDYKRISKAHGGTVNDVVLATVASALRVWLLARGEAIRPRSTIRALVPVSVRTKAEQSAMGNRISAYLVDLPIGEPDPTIRLQQTSRAMQAHKMAEQSIGADTLVKLSGFAPPTLHAAGARLASSMSRRLFNLAVTNVPGPQHPLYAAGAHMIEAFPVAPLAKGQALSIGVTSYDGKVYYGLNADRDAISDVEVLAELVVESLGVLLETIT